MSVSISRIISPQDHNRGSSQESKTQKKSYSSQVASLTTVWSLVSRSAKLLSDLLSHKRYLRSSLQRYLKAVCSLSQNAGCKVWRTLHEILDGSLLGEQECGSFFTPSIDLERKLPPLPKIFLYNMVVTAVRVTISTIWDFLAVVVQYMILLRLPRRGPFV